MGDVTSRAGLSGYLRDVERRVGERERANPIARASFHDGTRTRGAIGKFTHPDASEDYGAIFYDASGAVLFMVDDSNVYMGLPTSSAGLSAGELWVSGTSPNKYVRMA